MAFLKINVNGGHLILPKRGARWDYKGALVRHPPRYSLRLEKLSEVLTPV